MKKRNCVINSLPYPLYYREIAKSDNILKIRDKRAGRRQAHGENFRQAGRGEQEPPEDRDKSGDVFRSQYKKDRRRI